MGKSFRAAYIQTYESGELKNKITAAYDILRSCKLCPRECSIDRLSQNMLGICKTGEKAWVSSYQPHFGEEAPLVGRHGSGTLFFTHCNLLCNFCQNFDISHEGIGEAVTEKHLAGMMLALQRSGCHNINLVTPTHVVPQILAAVEIAAASGLKIPLVYNSSGYDRVSTLRLLEGVVDIYMPDFKFWDAGIADTCCRAPDYPEIARKAVLEMHRQVGDLTLDADGIAQRGVLIRHLVLPDGLAGTREIMKFIFERVSADTYVNIMAQYRPCGRAHEIPELSKPVSNDDVIRALREAKEEGITRLDLPRRTFVFW